MIEVFKTNVTDPEKADLLIREIHSALEGHTANFDLEDCDHILRVISATGMIRSSELVNLLRRHGFDAEVLPDEPSVTKTKISLPKPISKTYSLSN